jgi:F-type H+-transporting ATPase subunit b
MQEIIHAFGIDWRLIVIQIFNFGILAGVLWYFLYTPVLNILRDREEKIKKGVADAEAAAGMRKDADATKQSIIKEAHAEATSIVNRGTVHAEEKSAALLAEAQEKIQRNLKEAEKAASELKAAVLKESEAEVAKLAILGAEKILAKKLAD